MTAAPVEVLAAKFDEFAANADAQAATTDDPYYQGGGSTFRACAAFVRRDLAPAWDALAAERDAAREALGVACDSLENTAAGMVLSAMTSHPSKKSEIERGCAQAIRAIARTARAALGKGGT